MMTIMFMNTVTTFKIIELLFITSVNSMKSNPIILKVVIVIICILPGTIYLPLHCLKMSVTFVRYFFNI